MYGNYQYNPYMGQQMYKPIETSIQQQTMPQMVNMPQQRNYLNGKVVESIQVAKTIDVPCDGSLNFYAVADGSSIVTKQIQLDGTSKTIIYKPTTENENEIPQYATIDDVKKAIKEIDLSDIDDFKEEIKDLKADIKDLKKKKKDD